MDVSPVPRFAMPETLYPHQHQSTSLLPKIYMQGLEALTCGPSCDNMCLATKHKALVLSPSLQGCTGFHLAWTK